MLCKILAFFILPYLVISFKMETKPFFKDLNSTFDGHPEPMDPDFPGLEDLAIISGLDGASRLEANSLELRQSQGCNDNYPAFSQCPNWANVGYCSQTYVQWMAQNCKKSCNLCCNDNYPANSQCPSWASWACNSAQYGTWMASNCKKSCNLCNGSGANGYIAVLGKSYYIENEPLNYADAKDNCQNREGRLFEPRDLSTNDQVIQAALVISPSTRQTSDFWIGINDISTEGTFQYTSTGGDLVFTDWSYNEPNDSQGNEDCGITWFGTDWNDAPCVEKYHSICELDGCPKADGYINKMNKCFYIEKESLNYADAIENCQTRVGRLFEPRDLSTNDQVIEAALVISPSTRQTSDFWIGMNDIITEGTFKYTSTGTDLVFTDWSYNEPNDSQGNEDCGITWFGTDWNDAPCVEKYHSICEIGTADCFVENRLFVGFSDNGYTSAECKQKCEDTEGCKFWTWNTQTTGCGIRYYEVTTTLKAEKQITGRKGTGEELNDQVYVSKSFKTTGNDEVASRNICRNSCQADPKCLHFTLFGPNFVNEDKNTCVLNYGPAIYRQFGLPYTTGFASAPKFCP